MMTPNSTDADADHERRPRAPDHATEHVAAEVVGAERGGPAVNQPASRCAKSRSLTGSFNGRTGARIAAAVTAMTQMSDNHRPILKPRRRRRGSTNLRVERLDLRLRLAELRELGSRQRADTACAMRELEHFGSSGRGRCTGRRPRNSRARRRSRRPRRSPAARRTGGAGSRRRSTTRSRSGGRSRSTMSAPLISVPTLRPATVSRVRLEGRSACRHRIRRFGIPLLFAIRMKSSCSVATMSLRSNRE